MAAVGVDDTTVDEALRSGDRPSFLFVGAPWCGPCKMVGPHFEAMSGDYADLADFFTASLPEFEASAARFGVASTPTILVIRDAQVTNRRSGAMMRGQLEAWIRENLAV
ncbi:MAG: thioredoxin family protein [Pseudoclavibacter sp.]